jgi:pyruvate formate lyase activating enzyme
MRLSGGQLREKIEMNGTIFKIKRFSVHDGPGIRTAVFLKGCPLNCLWCHSPEGISTAISIWYDRSICIACGECVRACPEKALELLNDPDPFINIDRNRCSLAGDCVIACPTGAIQFTGFVTTVAEVLAEVEKDILYYQESGGGVTLTGGEPLNQPEFSTEILKSCREKKIHTAIETSLFCEMNTIRSVAEYVDLFITDLKIPDQENHIRYTGKSNDIIKENFRFLAESGKQIIVRIPMVEGITDTEENKSSIKEFVNGFDRHIPIEYIPYNPLAENNYKRLGIPFLLESKKK